KRLAWLTREIAAIPHVRRLRVHTRLPVVMVLHSNHANEFDAALGNAVLRLRQAGITLLNQTVLLRGVNDSLETLISLSETLGDHGILPYYLHVLDHVKGAQHFHVDDGAAMGL